MMVWALFNFILDCLLLCCSSVCFFIPVYHRLKVYTAYEFLENRFDLSVQTLTAILFLVQRGLAAGITICTPSIILSVVLGWDLDIGFVLVGVLVISYTMIRGTKAINVTQKQQMFIIFLGMFLAFGFILNRFPEGIGFSKPSPLQEMQESSMSSTLVLTSITPILFGAA